MYNNRKDLANEYFYYFTCIASNFILIIVPKSLLRLGSFSEQEKLLFQKQIELFKQNHWKVGELWGLFSIPFKHRNGRQCRDYYISSNLQNYRLEDENVRENIHFTPINKSSSCFDYYKDKIDSMLFHYNNEKENENNNNNNNTDSDNDLIPIRINRKEESSLPNSPKSLSNSPNQIKIKPLYLSSSESSESSTNSSPISSPINSPINSSSLIQDNNNNNYAKVIINNQENYSDSSSDNEQPLTELLEPLSPSNNNKITHKSRSKNRNRNSIKIIENYGNHLNKNHHKHKRNNNNNNNNNNEMNKNNKDKDIFNTVSLSPSSVNSESIIPHVTIIHNYKNSIKNRRSKKKQNNTQNIKQYTGSRVNINEENNNGNSVFEDYNDYNNTHSTIKPIKPVENEYSGRSLENKPIVQMKPQKIIQFSFPNYIKPIHYPISIQNQSFVVINDYYYYFDDLWNENDIESILCITFMKSFNCIINNENINDENQNCINILLSIDQYINYNIELNNNLSSFYEKLSNCIRNVIYRITSHIQQMNIIPSQVESILNIFFIYLYKWYKYCQNSEELFYFIISCHLYMLVINIKVSISTFSAFFIPFQIIQSFNTKDNRIVDKIFSSNFILYNNCKINKYSSTYKYNIFLTFTYLLLYKYEDQSKQYVKQSTIQDNDNSNTINLTKQYFNSLFKELIDKCSDQLPYIEELFKTTINIIPYLNYTPSDYINIWNSINPKYEQSLNEVNNESHFNHIYQCTDLFCDCRIHSDYLSIINPNIKNYSNTLSFYSCSINFLNQIIDPLPQTKRLSLIGEIRRSLNNIIFNQSFQFYNTINVHLLGINTIEVKDLTILFGKLKRLKKLTLNNNKNNNKVSVITPIDLEVLLQLYTIIVIKYLKSNIQYGEVLLEMIKLWNYIHSLSIISTPKSLFHFLYNTIHFIFDYLLSNNIINNEPIIFPFHECINMYLSEKIIYNYSDVIVHYIKMISTLLSHTQYEIRQQPQQQHSEENSLNNDDISDLDISLLVEENDKTFQSLLDKFIIDDLYPNYNTLLKAMINNLEPGNPILQDIYQSICIYEFQTISQSKNTFYKSFSFYSCLNNSYHFILKWLDYHPILYTIDDNYLELLLGSIMFMLFYQNNVAYKLLLHLYRIVQYNTQSNFYSIFIKKWLSDLDLTQKSIVNDISNKFIIVFRKTYELLQSNNTQQQYEKILSKIFIKIFTPFINLTNYQSNTVKIQRIESFALNCMIKIPSLLYSSIPLSPRWSLETILSNLYPYIDTEINRTEIINEFQSKHIFELLVCLLNTSFKGDIYIKAKIKHFVHYIINEFRKKTIVGEWKNVVESEIYKNLSEFFAICKYQSLGLLDMLYSIINEMILYINKKPPCVVVSYLLFLTAIFHSKQDNGNKFSCSIDSMIVFTNHHTLIVILYSIISILHQLWIEPKHSVLMKYCFVLIYKILTSILFQSISIISTQNPPQIINCCSVYNLNAINNNNNFIKIFKIIGLSCQLDVYNRNKNESFKKEFGDFKQLYYDLKIQNDCCITGIDTSNINNENLGICLKEVDDEWYKNFVEFLSKSNDVINNNETGLKEFKTIYNIITTV